MLTLKPANFNDIEKEWRYTKELPEDENGFTNNYHGVSFEEYRDTVLPNLIAWSEGRELPENFVAQTTYFLWDGDTIVGLFRIRHYLNDFLRQFHGHVGYGIGKDFRGKGYATAGLRLVIEECKGLIDEDEIYLSVHKDNPASLKVQQNCGAYIAREDDENYYSRIPLNP